jgi:hypothetical protein
MLAVTTVTCDAPGCQHKGQAYGDQKQARAALTKQGWVCDDKARTDYCPAHRKTEL